MTVFDLQIAIDEQELDDAGEALEALIELQNELDLPPALLEVLVGLDEVIGEALRRSQANGSLDGGGGHHG